VPDHFAGGGVIDRPPTAQGLPPQSPDDREAVRCLICNIEWPLIPNLWEEGKVGTRFMTDAEVGDFMRRALEGKLPCPVCQEPTSFATNFQPISSEEAWELRNQAEFERHYERTRGRHPDED
jgi:hypothetical protein